MNILKENIKSKYIKCSKERVSSVATQVYILPSDVIKNKKVESQKLPKVVIDQNLLL